MLHITYNIYEYSSRATTEVTSPSENNHYDDYWFPFTVGGNCFVTPETAFHGNISEVRVWEFLAMFFFLFLLVELFFVLHQSSQRCYL